MPMGIKPRPESKLASRLDPGCGSDPGPAPAARPRHERVSVDFDTASLLPLLRGDRLLR